jgi:hypothetical protein
MIPPLAKLKPVYDSWTFKILVVKSSSLTGKKDFSSFTDLFNTP